MALVLNTQITLNPGNQFARLSDDTGLVGATQYVIAGLYLSPNTRFVYEGTLDITLSVPPVGVPGTDTLTACTISTVQLPAPTPPPVAYPYAQKDRLLALDLNHSFESSAGAVPPSSGNGSAHLGKPWLDTSVSPPLLRVCAVPQASGSYVGSEWFTLAQVSGGIDHSNFYMPLAGDSTKNGSLNVTNNLSVGQNATITGTLNVSGNTTLGTNLYFGGAPGNGAITTGSGQVTIGTGTTGNLSSISLAATAVSTPGTLNCGTVTSSGSINFAGNLVGPNGYTLLGPGGGQASVINIDSANSNFAGSVSVNGNQSVGGTLTAGTVIGNGSVQSSGVYFQNNGGWFYTPQNLLSGGAVAVGGNTGIYWTNNGGWMYTPVGMWSSNINTGAINMNGAALSGCGNIAGAGVGSIGGVTMSGGGSIGAGNISCAALNTNGNPIDSGSVNSHGHDIVGGSVYGQYDDGYYCGVPNLNWVAVFSYGYPGPSGRALKTDITDAPAGALEQVLALRTVKFRWKSRPDDKLHHGFIADEAAEALGQDFGGYHQDTEGREHLDKTEMVCVLWQAVQELTARLQALEARS